MIHRMVWVYLIVVALWGCSKSTGTVIVYPEKSSELEILAAKEVRRYLYLRTGDLFPVRSAKNIPPGRVIIVAENDHPMVQRLTHLVAPEGGFFIKSEIRKGQQVLIISGDDAVSTLYGAYRFAEKLGCRFYLHGDVIPDEKIALDLGSFDEKGQPVTRNGRQWATRGIQPFQNFPPGAVMWGREDWMMYIAQLPKMGMNFVGLHTYMHDPEDDHVGDYGPNLNIWLGHERDLNPDGTVDFAFDATFFHTLQGIIGWGKVPTRNLYGGSHMLFPTDGYPSEIIGEEYHRDQEGYTRSFNRAAALFREVFSYAGKLDVLTATGIEIPVGRDAETGGEAIVSGIPVVLQDRLRNTYGLDPRSDQAAAALYRGMYRWLMNNQIPVDYFWMWTTEIWMPWGAASLDPLRVEAAKNSIRIAWDTYQAMENKPFMQFATGGWILGAQGDPDVFGKVLPDLEAPYACLNPPYNREGRSMRTEDWIHMIPEGRKRWPFTWMEYDYALEQPSFHMSRVLEDGMIAWEQHADGFLGEFWRTKMIAPMFTAVKDLSWDYASNQEEIRIDIPMNHPERHKKIDALYRDWAIHEFGSGPASEFLGERFSAFEIREDQRFMNVTNFIEGADDIYSQGYIKGDDWGSEHIWGPWEKEVPKLAWINEWEGLRSSVSGAGNLARFDYWLHTLLAYRSMAEFASELNQYEAQIQAGELEKAATHRSRLARLWEEINGHLVQRIHDEVDLGVILNLDWRTWRNYLVGKYDAAFLAAGGILPADHEPARKYRGKPFITCIPLRTHLFPGEALPVKALILGEDPDPILYYRELGETSFNAVRMEHDSRAVYRATIPSREADFEWYVDAGTPEGELVFPATVRGKPEERFFQTVVVSCLAED
jgi:hypothetical protein